MSSVSRWLFPSSQEPFLSDRKNSSSPERGSLRALKATLTSEQLALADEMDRTIRALDERLQALAGGLHAMDGDETREELQSLARIQESVRLSLRRLQASAKTSQELTRELKEWEDREEPLRVEVLRSELASRDPSRIVVRTEQMPVGARFIAPSDRHAEPGVMNRAPTDEDTEEIFLPMATESLLDPDTAHLIQAIREATHEAERWHAVPEEEHDEEILDQMHHVRDLHALLKQLDREQGRSRDRVAMAVNTREVD
jgi:hypothetical protein